VRGESQGCERGSLDGGGEYISLLRGMGESVAEVLGYGEEGGAVLSVGPSKAFC
jgi:hypothetical protein